MLQVITRGFFERRRFYGGAVSTAARDHAARASIRLALFPETNWTLASWTTLFLFSFLSIFFPSLLPFIALTRLSFRKYRVSLQRGMMILMAVPRVVVKDIVTLRPCVGPVDSDTFSYDVEQIVGEDCNRDVERGSDNWSSSARWGALRVLLENCRWLYVTVNGPLYFKFYLLDSMISILVSIFYPFFFFFREFKGWVFVLRG